MVTRHGHMGHHRCVHMSCVNVLGGTVVGQKDADDGGGRVVIIGTASSTSSFTSTSPRLLSHLKYHLPAPGRPYYRRIGDSWSDVLVSL